MATRAEHYLKAERLLQDARDGRTAVHLVAMAHVHALLSTASKDTEYYARKLEEK